MRDRAPALRPLLLPVGCLVHLLRDHRLDLPFPQVKRGWRGRTLTWVVGVMTLFAGAIGVSNVRVIAVAERTRGIGIRKAIGATPASIVGRIVDEATVLTGLAGYLGLCAGVGLLQLAAKMVKRHAGAGAGPRFFSSPELDLGKAVLAAAVLTVAGALAGLAPARAAVAVRPVEALAHE